MIFVILNSPEAYDSWRSRKATLGTAYMMTSYRLRPSSHTRWALLPARPPSPCILNVADALLREIVPRGKAPDFLNLREHTCPGSPDREKSCPSGIAINRKVEFCSYYINGKEATDDPTKLAIGDLLCRFRPPPLGISSHGGYK